MSGFRRFALHTTIAMLGAVALATWGTWPLAAHMTSEVYDPSGRPDPFGVFGLSDTYLTIWILAWDAHALFSTPARIFDANIFHPAPMTLALSEHMLGALPLYLPTAVLSNDPVFAHQATLLLTFACALLTGFALVLDWTGSPLAAIVSGVLFSFSSFRIASLSDIQILGNYSLPLIPLLARRAMVGAESRWPVLLCLSLILVSLHSYYLGYAAFLCVMTLAGAALMDTSSPRVWATRLCLPVVAAGLVVAASGTPYLMSSRSGAIPAPADTLVRMSSASLGHTGATPALILALMTAGWWHRGLRPSVRGVWVGALVAVALLGHLVALGPHPVLAGHEFPGLYAPIAQLVPGLRQVRVPSRFNAIVTMALSGLAGLGVAGWLRWSAENMRLGVGRMSAVAALGFAMAQLEWSLPGPMPLQQIETHDTLPAAYRWLADAPPGPLLELPFADFDLFPIDRFEEARRVYRSTYHWHPLLNGYSGYTPPTYKAVSGLVRSLPDRRAFELLIRLTGLRYVLIHGDRFVPSQVQELIVSANPSAIQTFGADVLLMLPESSRGDLMAAFIANRPTTSTLLGTRLASLSPLQRRASLAFATAPRPRVIPGLPFEIAVSVTNSSSTTWPGLGSSDEHLVTVGYRWEDEHGVTLTQTLEGGHLPYDLGAGETIRTWVPIIPPRVATTAHVVVGLLQDGHWFGGSLSPEDIILTP